MSQGEEFVRGVLQQTLLALVAMHTRNVTHRDIKPENLLLQQPEPTTMTGEPPPPMFASDPAEPAMPPPSAGVRPLLVAFN